MGNRKTNKLPRTVKKKDVHLQSLDENTLIMLWRLGLLRADVTELEKRINEREHIANRATIRSWLTNDGRSLRDRDIREKLEKLFEEEVD
jgi:hypothetical protein